MLSKAASGTNLPILDVCCPVAVEEKQTRGGHPILVAIDPKLKLETVR